MKRILLLLTLLLLASTVQAQFVKYQSRPWDSKEGYDSGIYKIFKNVTPYDKELHAIFGFSSVVILNDALPENHKQYAFLYSVGTQFLAEFVYDAIDHKRTVIGLINPCSLIASASISRSP